MLHQTFVDKHCAGLANTERTQPFGPDTVVWQVNGHMFAAYTEDGEGLSLRTNSAKQALRKSSPTKEELASYLIGGGWVVVPWETPPDDLRARIDESYRLVQRDWRPKLDERAAD